MGEREFVGERGRVRVRERGSVRVRERVECAGKRECG